MRRRSFLPGLAVLAVLAGCTNPRVGPRDPSEVAPVQTRDTTLYAPSTPGGYSQPGLGTTEYER